MTTLAGNFEDDLRDAVLDEASTKLVGEQANLVYQFIELVHTNLRAYAQANDYDVESTIDSLATPEIDRSTNTISVTIEWESPQMSRWEFGIDPHPIEAKNADTLAFVWEDPPAWVKEEFNQARSAGGEFASGWMVFFQSVDHPGIPESRAIRDALNGLNRVLRG